MEALVKDAKQALTTIEDRTLEDLFDSEFVTDMLPKKEDEECFEEEDRRTRLVGEIYDLLRENVTPKAVESAIKKMRIKGRLTMKGKLNPKILNQGKYTEYHGERSIKCPPAISISANLDSILREQDYADYEDLTAFEEAEEDDEDDEDEEIDDREHLEKVKSFFETLFHHMFEGLTYTLVEEEEKDDE
jgi:hypothetical protein